MKRIRYQSQVTGGRNGYGAKLCNIFSTDFIVETLDRQAIQLHSNHN